MTFDPRPSLSFRSPAPRPTPLLFLRQNNSARNSPAHQYRVSTLNFRAYSLPASPSTPLSSLRASSPAHATLACPRPPRSSGASALCCAWAALGHRVLPPAFLPPSSLCLPVTGRLGSERAQYRATFATKIHLRTATHAPTYLHPAHALSGLEAAHGVVHANPRRTPSVQLRGSGNTIPASGSCAGCDTTILSLARAQPDSTRPPPCQRGGLAARGVESIPVESARRFQCGGRLERVGEIRRRCGEYGNDRRVEKRERGAGGRLETSAARAEFAGNRFATTESNARAPRPAATRRNSQ
ncbi:hypothetical protein C8R43DRAFT_1140820 [Mycena crocata]|nr:hypothetical protein C8R43DRAFT_1140820 [Mycena crocata]